MVACPQSCRHKGKNGSGAVRVTRIGNNSKRCSGRLHSEKGLADVCGLHLNLRAILAYGKRGVFLSVSNFCNIMAIECSNEIGTVIRKIESTRNFSRISSSIVSVIGLVNSYRLNAEWP